MSERADKTAAHFKQHPEMDVSLHSCDDIHHLKAILLASRRVADNLQFELNALKPVTQASCNALRERVESTATFRRRLLSRCREEQLASLQQASSSDAVRRLQFFNAEFDVEAILADTVALRFKQTCRNAR